MKVAVLGSSGGMGSLFVRYLLQRGFEVKGSDRRRAAARAPRGFSFLPSNAEAVLGADVVIVAVPIDRTVAVVREVRRSLKRGSLLVEISSVKGRVVGELHKLLGSRVSVLSIHPLFGPTRRSMDGAKVAVVEGRRGSSATKLAASLFPDADLLPVRGVEEHDRLMSLTLSLTHATNLLYAATLSRHIEPQEFRRMGTVNSLLQFTLAEGILSQDPRLTSYIQTENRYTRDVIETLFQELTRLRRAIAAGDRDAVEKEFSTQRKNYRGDTARSGSLEKVYRASVAMG